MNFAAKAKKTLRIIQETPFTLVSDLPSKEEVLIKAFEELYNAGIADGQKEKKATRKPPQNPEGGWIPPNPKEFQKFWDETWNEAHLRFGIDEDNDNCVIVELTDLSRYDRTRMLPVPRSIIDSRYHPYGNHQWNKMIQDPITKKRKPVKHSPEEEETRQQAILENRLERFRMITGNFDIAKEYLRQQHNEIESEIRHKFNAPENARAQRIKILEYEVEYYADPVASLKKRGYMVDETTMTYWYPKDDGLDAPETRIKNVPKCPPNYGDLVDELARLKAYKPAKRLDL